VTDIDEMSDLPDLLARAELDVVGRLPDASNLTLLCAAGEGGVRCVYKPAAGERPLWDFPGAVLAAREVLTARAAGAFGWGLVPVTVWREEGPGGPGMCQEWVEVAPGRAPVGLFPPGEVGAGYHAIAEGHTPTGGVVVLAHESGPDLQRMVVLDALVNNGDRKGGHILRRADGGVVGIDHGVTFHVEPKLRSVLWGWAGQDLPDWLVLEIEHGADRFADVVEDGRRELTGAEARASLARLEDILATRTFPVPGGEWPALPWPAM
jgi:uncharacterized repeat protein (TIGR03843 family)